MIDERLFEGKDLEEALEGAASALGVPEADLHYEIVEQGRRGVFGLGARSVRIRIKPPLDEAADPTLEKPEPAKKSPPPVPQREGSSRREPSGQGQTRRKPPKREPSRRGQTRRKPSKHEQPRRKPPKREQPLREASPEEAGQVEQTVTRMVELIGLDVTVAAASGDGGVSLRLEGPDRKLLMDKNAELLWAMQFVLNRMARRAWPGVDRIHLSCNGQTRKRDDDLVGLVREVAQQVSRTGRTKKLEPMNAYERRLVHLTVREFTGLTSSSDGDGTMKRVRISKVQNQI